MERTDKRDWLPYHRSDVDLRSTAHNKGRMAHSASDVSTLPPIDFGPRLRVDSSASAAALLCSRSAPHDPQPTKSGDEDEGQVEVLSWEASEEMTDTEQGGP